MSRRYSRERRVFTLGVFTAEVLEQLFRNQCIKVVAAGDIGYKHIIDEGATAGDLVIGEIDRLSLRELSTLCKLGVECAEVVFSEAEEPQPALQRYTVVRHTPLHERVYVGAHIKVDWYPILNSETGLMEHVTSSHASSSAKPLAPEIGDTRGEDVSGQTGSLSLPEFISRVCAEATRTEHTFMIHWRGLGQHITPLADPNEAHQRFLDKFAEFSAKC